jgi:hypothetical protein
LNKDFAVWEAPTVNSMAPETSVEAMRYLILRSTGAGRYAFVLGGVSAARRLA